MERGDDDLAPKPDSPTELIRRQASDVGILSGHDLFSARISMWSPLSTYHIQAAAYFARRCREMEDDHRANHADKDWSWVAGHTFSIHRAYVMNSVISSVAYLDTQISELFTEVADPRRRQDFVNLWGEPVVDAIVAKWQGGFPHKDILTRLEAFLELVGKSRLDHGRAPWQPAKYAILLRNTLVHGAPEWLETGISLNNWSENNLRPRFEDNPLFPTSGQNPYFPDKCLSYGCAKWCFLSILALSDAFFGEIGAAARIDRLKMRAKILAEIA